MTRRKWAASGAIGALIAGLLIIIGVQAQGSPADTTSSAQQVTEVPATAAVETSRSADAAASASASAAAAAADKAAAERAEAAAAQQQAADAVAGRRAQLAAKSTVDAYFEAINAADYRTAFDLGGHNFNSSYDSFRAGFDNTASDEWDVTEVSGNRVYVTLTAHNLDCTTQVWHGYYVVTGAELTGAHLKGGKYRDCV